MIAKEIENLSKILAKLPSMGYRSSRRAVLKMLEKKEQLLFPLIDALENLKQNVKTCELCGNFDTVSPCLICSDEKRRNDILCVVESVADIWAIEKTSEFKGKYLVLGGLLCALDGVGPEQLNLINLKEKIIDNKVTEVILALPATMDGQTTIHYIADMIKELNVNVTSLALGMPIGGELHYMDEGTIQTAMAARKSIL